ncbi:shikimate kinase [Desulfohalotomaculum tongense]|uniref:shikimate kinase n=1 Tax=Desulforadius tongensis TaxID=1216062 RepID=UPI00195B22DA|nr:shikimate kinase [Desulforadius tongensis]MBM7854058.1 shikimate kinase [Desulforadius tongensis]
MDNIVLIGFMGCGKSVVGRKLASRLGLKHVDTDTEIERLTGKTVAQIFAKDGSIRFRSEETLLLKRLAGKKNMVISTGGGMVLNRENVELLKADGILIHLYASPEVIYNRVKGRRHRPLLNRGDLKQRIIELLKERAGAYDVAELAVDTGKYAVDEAVNQIIKYLKERKYIG